MIGPRKNQTCQISAQNPNMLSNNVMTHKTFIKKQLLTKYVTFKSKKFYFKGDFKIDFEPNGKLTLSIFIWEFGDKYE